VAQILGGSQNRLSGPRTAITGAVVRRPASLAKKNVLRRVRTVQLQIHSSAGELLCS
jgi:hypothetical protein